MKLYLIVPLLACSLSVSTVNGGIHAGNGLSLEGGYQVSRGGISLGQKGGRIFDVGAVVRGKFANSCMHYADLSNVDFQGVDFESSNLMETNFSGSNLKNTNFSKAKVKNALFIGTKGLTAKQVQALKKNGAKVVSGSLLEIAKSGDIKKAQQVIAEGAPLQQKDNDGNTPLHLATINNKPKIVELFLAKNAQVNEKNGYKETPLIIAARLGFDQIALLLIKKKALLEMPDWTGLTSLMQAAKNNKPKMVELLLKNKANPNALSRSGQTALIWAAGSGFIDICKILVKHKADPSIQDKEGYNAAYYAGNEGHQAIELYLIEADKKYDINKLDAEGASLLTLACASCNTKKAQLFLKKKALTDKQNLLAIAVLNGCNDVLPILIKHGVDPNETNTYGITPLIRAAEKGNKKAIEILIKHKADINKTSNNGLTALMIAANKGDSEIVKYLICESGLNAMALAAINDKFETADFLFEKTDLTTRCPKGNTFLHRAVTLALTQKTYNLTKYLISKGADVHAKNDQGITPLMLVQESNDNDLKTLFEDIRTP